MTIKNSARNMQLQNAAAQVRAISSQIADVAADPDPLGVQVLTGAANTLQTELTTLIAALKNAPTPPPASS